MDKEPFNWEMRNHITHPSLIPWMKAKEITIIDLMILYVADAMTKEERGCYSSNEYIAEAVGCHHLQVSKRIQHLNQIGLLVICYYKGERHIEPEWKRSEGDRRDMKGAYAKKHREGFEKMFNNKREINPDIADRYKSKDMRQRKVTDMRQRKVTDMRQRLPNVDNHKSNKIEPNFALQAKTKCGISHVSSGNIPFNQNGHIPSNHLIKPVLPKGNGRCRPKLEETLPEEDLPYLEYAIKLRDSLHQNRRNPTGMLKTNARDFRLIEQEDGQEHFREVLDFFCEHCSKEDMEEYNLPHWVSCARLFRKAFVRIEKSYDEHQNDW